MPNQRQFFFEITCPFCGLERLCRDSAESSARKRVAESMYMHLYYAHREPGAIAPSMTVEELKGRAVQFFTEEELAAQRAAEEKALRESQQLALPI